MLLNRERLIRATLLERLGLLRVMLPEWLTPEQLADTMASVREEVPPTRQRLDEFCFDFGGLGRRAEHVRRVQAR